MGEWGYNASLAAEKQSQKIFLKNSKKLLTKRFACDIISHVAVLKPFRVPIDITNEASESEPSSIEYAGVAQWQSS